MEENGEQMFSELQAGSTLMGGKYTIEKKIGSGGFGITYRAVQTSLNRTVCIKEYFLSGSCIRDQKTRTLHLQGIGPEKFEKYRRAFVKEAQTLAALHHQGIVEVIDVFDENNTSYMVMPFIEGSSLQNIVDKNGPLPYQEAFNYIVQVANAIGYIHKNHILHRDIKPDNIMITKDYKAILIDFGAAREFDEDKTQAHTSMLTHGYAPTEQYSTVSRKGAYTDIYALGATFYFIVTGKVPVEAAARLTEPMPEPRELNPSLPDEANRAIMKAMQLKSADRHQSAEEFLNDLFDNSRPEQPKAEPAKADQPEQHSASSEKAAVPKTDKSQKKGIAVLVGIVVAAAAVVGLLVAVLRPESPEAAARREAQELMPEYETWVKRCGAMIEHNGSANPEKLIESKRLLREQILDADKRFKAVMPEVYDNADRLFGELRPKLEQAAAEWAEAAYAQVSLLDDTATACEYYHLSLELMENASVRVEARMYNCAD